MKHDGWPAFSFTDLLRPPEGWKTEHAILTTYSADLVVIVTALLALTGCDLDHRRTGSRVELVRAIEALRGRVCVLAQAGRVAVPNTPRLILKLLDKFLRTVETDENEISWHPKVAMVRYHRVEDATDRQWRVWLGSRNLTRATNWETGLILASRADGRGQQIDGLARLGVAVAKRANLATLSTAVVAAELAALTWESPPGSEVQSVNLLGPDLARGFPTPPFDAERVFVVSPFLDAKIVRAAAGWGSAKTRRTLVSTTLELQRLLRENNNVFTGFDRVLIRPFPDLPVEGADLLDEEPSTSVEPAESEEMPPAGLHAKLFFAAKGARRQLWIGSANATERGWAGRNYEVVAELFIGRDSADAIEGFVAACDLFKPSATPPSIDQDEEALEKARKLLSADWSLRQRVGESEVEVVALAPPPLTDPAIQLEVAALGGTWKVWARDANCIVLPSLGRSQRSDFLQVRLCCGERMCAWLQVAPCDPSPDVDRDRALIAQYLDPRTFLIWLRSVLADEPARAAGGDWDADHDSRIAGDSHDRSTLDVGLLPTVEEILRAWARDASAFVSADEKVKSYLLELERRAVESTNTADVELLQTFQRTWNTLASELR
ncbi:MAG: phospholipase D family protein [Verrucomicrobia bacterium]|nr:phospholipase D family protein [Verrucomicrobiota bacterium]